MSEQNTQLALAREYILNTRHNIYLTGKAGTGKTTFLHGLQQSPPKRMVVTAPTGVAAINARGVTLHSFFQLPFGPFIPGTNVVPLRFSREKINIIKSLELLVIDEISMVRADVLDAVDSVLRRYTRTNLPFGGVQLLMIGDLHQLSPVVKKEEQALLQQHYTAPYFFASTALQATKFITIELEHIYRQSDPHFIALLNRVRNNDIDLTTLAQLNARNLSTRNLSNSTDPGNLPITLSTHNKSANSINNERLKAISNPEYRYEALVTGDYPEHAYPCGKTLVLKAGAQVMFARNDRAREKRYYNGKIGVITRFDDDYIWVQCPQDTSLICVEIATWENIKYSIDPNSKEITETVVGSFTQYPLRLAWAITIHKAQGLTFDSVIIDADAAFAPGQIYVALSRCKTLQGITLSREIPASAIHTDAQVEQFSQYAQQHPPTPADLQTAKIAYQQELIAQCFDFHGLSNDLNRLNKQLSQNAQVIQHSSSQPIADVLQQVRKELVGVSEKFQSQLQSLYSTNEAPQDNAYIQERIQKASHYFSEKLNTGLLTWLRSFSHTSDNQAQSKKLKQIHGDVQTGLTAKAAGIVSCREGFSSAVYLHSQSLAEIELKHAPRQNAANEDYKTTALKHPELFQRLKAWRDQTAEMQDVARYVVLHQRVLFQIAERMPRNGQQLLKVRGIGKGLVEKYGEALIDIVEKYCQENHIEIVDEPEPSKTKHKNTSKGKHETDTKISSYELFRAGKTIRQIAEQRGLVISTIEGHLAYYVGLGELALSEVMEEEKIKPIEAALLVHEGEGFKFVKELLGKNYSYGEIKMVKTYLSLGAESL